VKGRILRLKGRYHPLHGPNARWEKGESYAEMDERSPVTRGSGSPGS